MSPLSDYQLVYHNVILQLKTLEQYWVTDKLGLFPCLKSCSLRTPKR